MTRFLAVDVKDLAIESILIVTGSILVLTLAVLALQIAASRFATPPQRKELGPDFDTAAAGGRPHG